MPTPRPAVPGGRDALPDPLVDDDDQRAAALFDRLMAGPLRLAAPDGPEAPERVGEWTIRERIGTGGLSTVHVAIRSSPAGPETAALKLAKRPGDETDALFAHEAALLRRLRTGVVHLLDAGAHDDGRSYLALELIEGRPLAAVAGEQSAWERLLLLRRLCRTVEGLHQEDVVHADLKPDHLFVRDDGAIVVIDLGLARDLRQSEAPSDARRLGLTPEFAAPEQILGGEVGPAADVYALGLVIREILEGRRRHLPWVAGGEAEVGLDLPDDARAPSGAPLERYVEDVLRTALQPDPARRFPTAGALAQALDDVLDVVSDGARLA